MFNLEIKVLNRILFLLFSFLVIFISINQSNYFHWSAILDQDTIVIYNSLLLSSGFEQEYRDHPAYSTFFIYGVLIKFFSIINLGPVSEINDLIFSVNPNKVLQDLFFFCRKINVIINIFLVYFLYKSLIKLKCDEVSSSLGCIILIVSGWFTESLFVLRSENLSIIFFLISLIFQLKFYESKKPQFIIISGLFLGIAMLTKIQIIFLFIFQIFINLIYLDKFIKKNFIKNLTKNYDLLLFLFYFLFLILYLVLQLKLQTYERFEKIKYLDLVLFIIFNFSYLFFALILNKFNYKKIKLFIIFLSLFFIGFSLSIILTIFFDLVNFVELNRYILLRLTNPFHYMVEFHVGDHLQLYENAKVNLDYFLNLFLIAISKYDYNFSKIFILLIITIISIRNDLLNNNKDKKYVYKEKILIFISVLFIIYILNLRGFIYYYETYVVIPYVLAFSYFLKNFSEKFSRSIYIFLIIYFAYCNFYLSEKKKYGFKYYFTSQSSLSLICSNKIYYQDNSYRDFMKYYHHRFDDDFIDKLCLDSIKSQ